MGLFEIVIERILSGTDNSDEIGSQDDGDEGGMEALVHATQLFSVLISGRERKGERKWQGR